MKRIAPILFGLVLIVSFNGTAFGKAAKIVPDNNQQDTIEVRKTGFGRMEMPEGEGWQSATRVENKDGIIQIYYPEGSNAQDWKEMIQLEANWYTNYTNPRTFARLLAKQAERAYPVVVFDIVSHQVKDIETPYTAFRLKLGFDTAADGFSQTQLWKLMQRGHNRFVAQYSYKGDKIPEEREAQMWGLLKEAYICDSTLATNPCYDPEKAKESKEDK
jgi:hypothetical protein